MNTPADGMQSIPDASDSGVDPPPPALPARAVQALCDLLARSPSPPSNNAPTGDRGSAALPNLPGYEVLEELGRGGMARVFRARHHRLGRLVALKLILTGPHADAEQMARLQNEAEAVARLQHPHIVQIHEVGEHDGLPYLALELVEGGNLGDKLAGTPLPASAAAELVEVLARAVEAAHGRGVVHRDLKPANILLTAEGTPKISDFGLAKQLDDAAGLTQTGAILGTPSYMAPEQAEGKIHAVGPPADIYALGAILYETLTGRPPFRAPTVLETLDQVRHREPLSPRQLHPSLPRDLQTICLKCLEKDPRKRYASAQELGDDLARFRRGEPIHARPISRPERWFKWARRRPALAALYCVSALAAATLIVGGLAYQSQLVTALRRAESNEARADAGYKNARAALKQILGRLAERNLADVPQLLELQRQQYEDALVFYREILKHQDEPDPTIRLDVAVAFREAGILQQRLGQEGPAEENYRQAVAVLEQLVAEHPLHAEYRGQLAATCNNIGILLHANKDEAERWLRKALGLRGDLHRLLPDDPNLQEALAQSNHSLASHLKDTGRDPTEFYEKALALREPLLSAYPENNLYAVRTAETYSALGVGYLYRGKLERAEEGFRKAEAILVPLARDHPENVQHALTLAGLRINWVMLLQKQKRLPEALDKSAAAIGDLEAVLRREPNLVDARLNLLSAHGGRAQALAGAGRFAEAMPHWDRLLELADKHPNRDLFRLERALTLARAGDHLRAAAEVDEFSKREKAPAEWLYHLACVSARAAAAAAKDEMLVAAERVRLADEHAATAVKLLVRARASGYFNTPSRLFLLRTDAHLESLRKRMDYQETLKTVGKAP